jgi:hypothetical protein
MASPAKLLESEISGWPGVSVAPHRFGGREFQLGKAEIGHVHFWGDVDIPFTRAIRDQLIAEGIAVQHRWLPDSGWVTFHMSDEQDVERAVWLMQLSYLRYSMKMCENPRELLEREARRMRMNPKVVALLEPFIPPDKAMPPIAAQVN